MPELLDRITTKVGPLPAWAWAAIPAAGYVAWSYYRASQGTAEGVTDAATGGAEGTDAEDYGINTGGVYLPGYGSAPGGSSNIPPVSVPAFDNLAWARQAVNYLISEGIPALDAVTAINAYIYGVPSQITQAQFNALQKAIQKFGPAPEAAFPPTVKPPTTTPPPAPVIKVPEAPTTVSFALANPTTATVRWGPPAQNGGSAIIGYKVETSRYDAATKKWVAHTSKLTLAGTRAVNVSVVQRNTYFVAKVSARNIKGYGAAAGSQSIRTAAK